MAYLAHFLANYPEVQEKMRAEILSVFPDEVREPLKHDYPFHKPQDVPFDNFSKLPYTEAAIKESLRHYPLASLSVNQLP